MSPNQLLQRRHWIFDLDGTLTIAAHDFFEIRRILDIGLNEDILAHLNTLSPEVAATKRAALHEWEQALAHQSTIAPGAAILLNTLHQDGVKLSILTRNTREHTWISLNAIGLGDYFDESCVIGRQEAPPKPAPDGIHKLLQQQAVAANETLMIGDYIHDLHSGRAAGVATVHVDTSGDFIWSALMDHGVSSLLELHEQRQQCIADGN